MSFEKSEYSAFWCAPPDKHPGSQKTGNGHLPEVLQDASLAAVTDKQDGAEKDEYFHHDGVPASFFAAGGEQPGKYACTSIVFDFFGIFCGAFMVFTQCDKT